MSKSHTYTMGGGGHPRGEEKCAGDGLIVSTGRFLGQKVRGAGGTDGAIHTGQQGLGMFQVPQAATAQGELLTRGA